MRPFLGSDAASFRFLVLVVISLIVFSTHALPALGYEPWSIAARRYRAESWEPWAFLLALVAFLVCDFLVWRPWAR